MSAASKATQHWTLLLVGLLAAIYFWLAPVQQMSDASFTIALSERILKAHSLDLAPVVRATPRAQLPFQDANGDLPLHMVRRGEQQYYAYPIWTSVLLVPWVALLNAAGWHALDANGAWQSAQELKMQRLTAALLGALIVVLLLKLSGLLTTPRRALLMALLLVIGSSIASTLSRALWAQTMATVLLSCALLHALGRERAGRDINAPWLAALLLVMVLLRQPLVFSAAALLAWVAWAQPQRLRALLGWGLALSAAVAFFHWLTWAQLTPPSRYGPSLFTFERVPARLYSLLFAASRGVAIYLPLALLALVVAFGVALDERAQRWRNVALLAIAGQLLLLACYRPWAGGGAYGPRLLAELTPWWALLAALVMAHRPIGKRWFAALLLLGSWQSFIHIRGAWNQWTFEWNNIEPTYVAGSANFHGWRYPQFLAGWRDRPYPPVAATPLAVLNHRVELSGADTDIYIDSDIGPAQTGGRAITGPYPQLRFVFSAPPIGAEVVELVVSSHNAALIAVFLNDQNVLATTVMGERVLAIKGEFRRGNLRNNSIRLDCAENCEQITLKALQIAPSTTLRAFP